MPDNGYPGLLGAIANGQLFSGQQTGLLGAIASGALNLGNWGNSPPPPAIDNSSVQPGATALAGQPLRRVPITVQPAITGGNSDDVPVSIGRLTGILYNETSSQRPGPDAPDMDTLRGTMANAIVNGWDQGEDKKNKNYTAQPEYKPGAMNAILAGILDPNGYQGATKAWFSSLGAAIDAATRSVRPDTGPGSGVFFNGRPDAGAGPNVNRNNLKQEPFVGTMGPYYGGEYPWWAFFGNPDSGS